MHYVCPHCFVTNRIGEEKPLSEAKCGKCNQSLEHKAPVDLNDSNFYRFVEKNDLPVIVDFWASWCGPCKMMAPVFSKVAEQSDDIRFAKVSTEEAQKVSGAAGIRSIPTLIFFHRGKEINRISGALNEAQLKQWIMQTLQSIQVH